MAEIEAAVHALDGVFNLIRREMLVAERRHLDAVAGSTRATWS
jgi:hypothetical protein